MVEKDPGEFLGRLVTKALESFGAGSSSVEGGSRAVRAGVQRINAQVIKRLVGTLLKFTVQWGSPRDVDLRVFVLARCGYCR